MATIVYKFYDPKFWNVDDLIETVLRHDINAYEDECMQLDHSKCKYNPRIHKRSTYKLQRETKNAKFAASTGRILFYTDSNTMDVYSIYRVENNFSKVDIDSYPCDICVRGKELVVAKLNGFVDVFDLNLKPIVTFAYYEGEPISMDEDSCTREVKYLIVWNDLLVAFTWCDMIFYDKDYFCVGRYSIGAIQSPVIWNRWLTCYQRREILAMEYGTRNIALRITLLGDNQTIYMQEYKGSLFTVSRAIFINRWNTKGECIFYYEMNYPVCSLFIDDDYLYIGSNKKCANFLRYDLRTKYKDRLSRSVHRQTYYFAGDTQNIPLVHQILKWDSRIVTISPGQIVVWDNPEQWSPDRHREYKEIIRKTIRAFIMTWLIKHDIMPLPREIAYLVCTFVGCDN